MLNFRGQDKETLPTYEKKQSAERRFKVTMEVLIHEFSSGNI